MSPRLPANEPERLAALESMHLVESAQDQDFDAIVRLLATATGAPIALITVITDDRQWMAANLGLEHLRSTPRDAAFCAHTILDTEVLMVPDAATDPRFATNPLVTGDPKIRFYAGAPLITSAGHALGALCAIDRRPRVLTEEQLATLRQLASIVSALIEAKAARQALAASNAALEWRERQVRAIADNVPAMIGYVDVDERVQYANRHWLESIGSGPNYAGQALCSFIGPEFYSAAERPIRAALAGHSQRYSRIVGTGDSARHHEINLIPDVAPGGHVVGVFGLTYDVTDRERSDAALRASQTALKSLFATMSEGLVVQAQDGRIIDANLAAETVLGLSRDELLGKRSVDPDWRAIRADGSPFPGEEHPAMITLRTGQPVWRQVMGVCRAQAEPRWISINAQPIPGPQDEHSPAVICTFIDITEERRAYDRIRSLVQRLESAREEERHLMARTLHEGFAQDLFAMSLLLRRLPSDHEVSAAERKIRAELTAAVRQCMADIRQVANDLWPAALANVRVARALEEHARYFAVLSDLQIEVEEVAPFPTLHEPTRLLLFRVAQEALTNVARHARATKVRISLRADAQTIALEVRDNGIGIAEDSLKKAGSLGLLGMQERLEAAGGRLRIERAGPQGTALVASLPRTPEPP